MNVTESEKITNNQNQLLTATNNKNFPIEYQVITSVSGISTASAAMKTTDPKNVRSQFRMISGPAGQQGGATAQIIQTHIMPQQILKQIDTSRTQITGLPRSGSITVSRTPTNFVPRGPTNSNIRGNLITPHRAPTPPSTITQLGSAFVRGSVPKTPIATVLSPGSTQAWISSGGNAVVQLPTQLIRASSMSAQSPRHQPRILTQSGTICGASISTSISQQNNQIVSSTVNNYATLATVMPARQPAATLVYTNPQQHQYNSGQRLAVATSITGQRQIRPIPLSNTRIQTSGGALGIRVTTANISIRTPNVPVLAPASVLQSMSTSSGGRTMTTGGIVSTANLSTSGGIPGARIIQVQQQQSGGVINASRIAGNVMTLHPVIINKTAGGVGTVGNHRYPATISSKVQPSLTITQVNAIGSGGIGSKVNISSSALPGMQPIISNNNQNNNLQHQTVMSIAGEAGNNQQQITQILNVNQLNSQGQIVSVSQQQGSNATVMPINTLRNQISTNVLTGTITSIQPSSTRNIIPTTILPIAKVLPQQQLITSNESNNNNPILIHACSPSSVGIVTPNSGINATTNVLSSSALTSGTTTMQFPTSGTFFYEHSTNASTGNPVLTLTTSSVNSCGGGGANVVGISSGNQINSSNIPSNLITSVAYSSSGGSFAVVPANNNRIMSQQSHGIVTTSNQQHHSVPVRFNPQLIVDGSTSGAGQTTHQIITVSQQHHLSNTDHQSLISSTNNQTHMLIPVKTKALVAAGSPRPSILKKRENEAALLTKQSFFNMQQQAQHISLGLKAAKNLGPTLLSMCGGSTSATTLLHHNINERELNENRERDPSPQSRPASSEGSTTVSATSSPGIDQQEEQEELSAMSLNTRLQNADMQFKPVETIYSSSQHKHHHNSSAQQQQQIIIPQQLGIPSSSGGGNGIQIQHHISTGSSSNENNCHEISPRKKPRKQQLGSESNLEAHLQYYVNDDSIIYSTENNVDRGVGVGSSGTSVVNNNINLNNKQSNGLHVNDKENTPVLEISIKKPRTSLLENYKQSWKPVNNHFQRYSDVKPREERRPNVMDLANQAHVLQKVNGWKIYHLSSQMEDLCELESQVHSKLSNMLTFMEAHETHSDIERVNDLIKGNIQRSKVIIDGINEAGSQIMKIFDHKTHVSDIIHRCASKRNFKKREKV